MDISDTAIGDIIGFEIGDQAAYDEEDLHPTYPGDESGVTIGLGYDLGYADEAIIAADWAALGATTVGRLQAVSGITAGAAERLIPSLKDISVPFDLAETVFTNSDIPRTIALVRSTFSGCDTLSPDSLGALVSLVFNRGSDCSNTPSRREMYQIKQAMAAGNVGLVPGLIFQMRRLWPTLPGLVSRRAVEAALFQSGLPEGAVAQLPTGTTLRPGARVAYTYCLQVALQTHGYYTRFVADGDYGIQTKTAVASFQAACGLSVDGEAGEATLTKLGMIASRTGASS